MFGYNITTLIIILAIALLFRSQRLPDWRQHQQGHRSFKGSRPDSFQKQEIPGSATTAAPHTFTCPQCNKEYSGDVNFCPHCGQRIVKG
jgi:hypothetical protein